MLRRCFCVVYAAQYGFGECSSKPSRSRPGWHQRLVYRSRHCASMSRKGMDACELSPRGHAYLVGDASFVMSCRTWEEVCGYSLAFAMLLGVALCGICIPSWRPHQRDGSVRRQWLYEKCAPSQFPFFLVFFLRRRL